MSRCWSMRRGRQPDGRAWVRIQVFVLSCSSGLVAVLYGTAAVDVAELYRESEAVLADETGTA